MLVSGGGPGFVGELLALAVIPARLPEFQSCGPRAKSVLKSPTRGKPSTWARNVLVVHFIRAELRKNPKEEAALSCR
jgi:hypothetical protein